MKEIFEKRRGKASQVLLFEKEEKKEDGISDLKEEFRDCFSICHLSVAGIFCSGKRERNYAIVIEELDLLNKELG